MVGIGETNPLFERFFRLILAKVTLERYERLERKADGTRRIMNMEMWSWQAAKSDKSE